MLRSYCVQVVSIVPPITEDKRVMRFIYTYDLTQRVNCHLAPIVLVEAFRLYCVSYRTEFSARVSSISARGACVLFAFHSHSSVRTCRSSEDKPHRSCQLRISCVSEPSWAPRSVSLLRHDGLVRRKRDEPRCVSPVAVELAAHSFHLRKVQSLILREVLPSPFTIHLRITFS